MSTASGAPASATRRDGSRRLYWRLPLALVLLGGLATLYQVDRLLRREYVREAAVQALQTDALLESFVRQRVALLTSLRAAYVAAGGAPVGARRFRTLVGEVLAETPDIVTIYVLDSGGRVVTAHNRAGERLALTAGNHLEHGERAIAIHRARRTMRPALTSSLPLRSGGRGMLAYVPILRDSAVIGYIGGALAYQPLFNDALATQLTGQFAYRIRNEQGTVIGASPGFPTRPHRLHTRDVQFPGGHQWLLDVAIPPFQPMTARLVTWLVGAMFLAMVAFLVMREEARMRRLAAHSAELETLSRNLLDANVRLEERAQQVTEANRAKSRFLANVSHELRTPLNAIVGYNSLALDEVYGPLPAYLRDSQQRIRTAAEHLLALVNDVLDLAKIEVGRLDVDLEETDLGAVLDGVLSVVEPIAVARGVRLDLFVHPRTPRLWTDPRLLRQIVMNLASNALKFTDRGSVVMVARPATDERTERRPAEERVHIVVQDTGIGIAEQDLDRIFEEFEQVRPSGRGDSIQRGTGLGLAIARKLARVLGGDITVESQLGAGSRFTVDLPIRAVVTRVTPSREHTPVAMPAIPDAMLASTPPASEAPPEGAATALDTPADATVQRDPESGEGAALSGSPGPSRRLDSDSGDG